DRRSDWASVAPLKSAAGSTGWGGRTVVRVRTKRSQLRIARNRGGRIATSSAFGKPPQRLVAVTQQLVADGDLVEHLGDVRRERRRLREKLDPLLLIPQRRVVPADVRQQIFVPRRFPEKVGGEGDRLEVRLPDLRRVGALVGVDPREQPPRAVLRGAHLDRSRQRLLRLRVFPGFGQDHAEVPDAEERRFEVDRLLERAAAASRRSSPRYTSPR